MDSNKRLVQSELPGSWEPLPAFKKQRFVDVGFFVSYGIWLFVSVLQNSFYSLYIHYNITSFGCVLVLVLVEIIDGKNKKQSLSGITALLLVAVVAFQARMWSIAYTAIFIYCARGIDFKKIASFSIAVIVAGVLVVMMSAWAGVIKNVVTSNGRMRMYLGFRYALIPAQYLFAITVLTICVLKEKLDWRHVALLIMANALVFFATNSRLCFALSMFCLILALALKYFRVRDNIAELVSTVLTWSFVICAIIGVGLTFVYDSSVSWMSSLNASIEGRLALGHDGLDKFGVPLLGQKIEFVGNSFDFEGVKASGTYDYIDCLYVQLLVLYGPIFTLVFLILMTAACKKVRREGNYFALVILSVISVYSMMDPACINLRLNPALFLLAGLMNPGGEMGWYFSQKLDYAVLR